MKNLLLLGVTAFIAYNMGKSKSNAAPSAESVEKPEGYYIPQEIIEKIPEEVRNLIPSMN